MIKETILKCHHRKFKALLSDVQCEDTVTEQQLISYVFKQITDIETAVDYCEPIEWYIRRYKQNEYDIEADEVQMQIIKTICSKDSLEVVEPTVVKTTVNKFN